MLLSHVNTFILVQCLSLLVASAVYGWNTAYLKVGKSKLKTTKLEKIRESVNNVGKMLFVFLVTIGVSWVIDYVIW